MKNMVDKEVFEMASAIIGWLMAEIMSGIAFKDDVSSVELFESLKNEAAANVTERLAHGEITLKDSVRVSAAIGRILWESIPETEKEQLTATREN